MLPGGEGGEDLAKPAQLHVRTDGNLDSSFAQNVQGGLGDKASTEHEHLPVERRERVTRLAQVRAEYAMANDIATAFHTGPTPQ